MLASLTNLFTRALVVALALGVALTASALWTVPSSPPNDNAPAPINVGSASQTKSGWLSLGASSGPNQALDVYGKAVFQGPRITIGNGTSGTYQPDSGTPGIWFATGPDPRAFIGLVDSATYGVWVSGWRLQVNSAGTVIPSGNSLCLGSDCRTSWPSSSQQGGFFIYAQTENQQGYCSLPNYYRSPPDCGCPDTTWNTAVSTRLTAPVYNGPDEYHWVYQCYR